VLSGRNKPGLDFLEKVLIEYPRVNAMWLITGEVGQENSVTNVNEPVKQTDSVKQTDLKEELHPASTKIGQHEPGEVKEVEKIVVFYTDQTFKSYKPSEI
jgi:hypothetical protein